MFDSLNGVDMAGRWWNGAQGAGRLDILLFTHDGQWEVRAYEQSWSKELRWPPFDSDDQALELVRRLIDARPASWQHLGRSSRR